MVQFFLEERFCRCLFFSADYKEIVESLVQIQIANFLGQINPIFAELIVVTSVSGKCENWIQVWLFFHLLDLCFGPPTGHRVSGYFISGPWFGHVLLIQIRHECPVPQKTTNCYEVSEIGALTVTKFRDICKPLKINTIEESCTVWCTTALDDYSWIYQYQMSVNL